MKTSLFVFSGTGNGLFVAQHLRSQLKDNCELLSIPRLMAKGAIELSSASIGFIFPLYFGGLPKLMRQFIDQVKIAPDSYIFAIVTSGAGSPGNALYALNQKLGEKGSKLDAGFSIHMPTNYILGWYFPLMQKIVPAPQFLYQNALRHIASIIPLIKNQTTTPIPRDIIMGLVPKINNPRTLVEKLDSWDRDFWTNAGCQACGTCEKVCPVKNVKLENGKPSWKHNCQLCLRCVGNCPKQAIEFKNIIKKRPRYHQPEIKTSDWLVF